MKYLARYSGLYNVYLVYRNTKHFKALMKHITHILSIITFLTVHIVVCSISFLVQAQHSDIAEPADTVYLSYAEFLEQALKEVGQLQAAESNVKLAENQVQQVKDLKFIPSLSMTSEHGILPRVVSPNGLPDNQIYLDPDATYDWENWGFANRFRISGVQPLFIWGAVDKAVEAAQYGVNAISQQRNATKDEIELQLHQLYYGYQLALEIERLLDLAVETMNTVERSINQQRKDSPELINESEIYKFKVFQAQFKAREDEVKQNLLFVRESWEYILNAGERTFLPENGYLEAPEQKVLSIDYYQTSALMNRPEIKALSYAEQGARMYMEAKKSENRPSLYMGFTGTFARAPSRPRQDNPFISSDGNTLNMSFGFSIRQNLNFIQMRTTINRASLEIEKISYQQKAIKDLVMLDVHEKYRDASIAESKYESSSEALRITKEWLRMEQLDYDFGIGEVRDVVDALKQELELRLEEKQTIFDYKVRVASLNKASGLPIE